MKFHVFLMLSYFSHGVKHVPLTPERVPPLEYRSRSEDLLVIPWIPLSRRETREHTGAAWTVTPRGAGGRPHNPAGES